MVEVTYGPRPEPGPGEILVRSSAVGICGSDLHALEGAHPFIELPVLPGHEAAGIVEALGEGVTGFSTGQSVLLEPNLVCGRCPYCVSGRYNLCESLKVVGCQTAGAMAQWFRAPERRFHEVPGGMSATEAAMVEPLATATHAARVAGDLSGTCVAVLGAGSIGLLCMLTARARGAEAVAVTDPVAPKRARALELGADLVGDPASGSMVREVRAGLPRRPDVVFDCVSTQGSLDQAIELALNGGTVVSVGVARGPVKVALQFVQDREIRIQGTAMYVREDVLDAIALIGSGAVPASRLVTARFPLEEAAAAFEAAASGAHVKVHIEP